MTHHHIGGHAGFDNLGMQRVGDCRGHARGDGHGQKAGVDAIALWQAKTDIGCTTGGVDFELIAQPMQQAHHLNPGLVDRTNRHHQGVDHDIAGWYAVIGCTLNNFLGHCKTHIRVLRDAGFVIRNGNHGGTVFLDQGQHGLQPIFFAGDGIDQCLAFVNGKPRLQGSHDGRINRQGNISDGLHQLDRAGQQGRLIRQGDAGVDIKHVRPRLDLCQGIGNHPAVIASDHLGGQNFSPSRVDALTNDNEGPVKTDHHLAGGGTDHGVCHAVSFRVCISASRPGYQGTRPSSTPERSMISATESSWR